MAILIDTQIFIWSVISPNKLSDNVKKMLQNQEVLVSYVSLFEIAIKQKIGKLPELSLSIDELSAQAMSDNFQFLEISTEHISAYQSVPFFPDLHKDPFDRLIIATALSENLPVISADEKFKLYDSLITLIRA